MEQDDEARDLRYLIYDGRPPRVRRGGISIVPDYAGHLARGLVLLRERRAVLNAGELGRLGTACRKLTNLLAKHRQNGHL